MAKSNNRGGGNNRGRSSNNNPTGRNQYSDWGVSELVRERPFAAAAAAAGAAAAGLFLWSKRSQISQQLSDLSDQIGEWSENMNWGNGSSSGMDDTGGLTTNGQSGMGSTTASRSASGSRSGTSRGRSTAGTTGTSPTSTNSRLGQTENA